ncbi:hypothetical protein ACFLY9_00480 [Patescibacteria group bacterium]
MPEGENGEQEMCQVVEIGGKDYKIFQAPECESVSEHGLVRNCVYILMQSVHDGENVMPLPALYLGENGDGNTFCFLVLCEYIVDESSQSHSRIHVSREDVENTVFKPVNDIDLLGFPPVIVNTFERYVRYGAGDNFKVIPRDPSEIVEKMMKVGE